MPNDYDLGSGPPPTDDGGPAEVVGVIALILGFAGLALLPFPLLVFYPGSWQTHWHIDTPDVTWLFFATVAGLGLSLLALVSGVGIMYRRPWARASMLSYGVLSLALGIVGAFFMPQWILPGNGKAIVQARGFSGLIDTFAWMAGTIFAPFVIYHLSRRRVRSAIG